MTHAQLVQLAGSIVAILALAGFARWLKLGESRITTAEDARRFAEEALAGFEGGRVVISYLLTDDFGAVGAEGP